MDWACALILPAKLKSLRNFSTVYLETSRQTGEENMDIQRGLIWFLRDQFLMNVDDSSWLVSAILSSSGGDQKLGVSKLTKWNRRILPLIHNFKGLNGYRARVGSSNSSSRVVVGLSIVRPTTKQWGKVEVGLGFGNIWASGASHTQCMCHAGQRQSACTTWGDFSI